jgi:hypothetical protein
MPPAFLWYGDGYRDEEMTALIIIEGVVIALLVVLVAGLLRSHGEILRQLNALGVGEHGEQASQLLTPQRTSGLGRPALTTLAGPTPQGAAASVALSGSRGYTLLAFLSSTCTACRPFWEEADGIIDLRGVRTVVVTKDPEEESPSGLARLAPSSVTAVMSSEAWNAFKVPATPYFALVDTADARVVGEGSAANWDRVADMVRRAVSDAAHPLHRSTTARKADIDAELTAAGIEPGDPRLYQPPTS